jgi:hypothetical protein
MEVACRLSDLVDHHPRLSWADIVASAAATICGQLGGLVHLRLDCYDIPTVPDRELFLDIECDASHPASIERIRRTYDEARLVEFAAIAVAGLVVYHGLGEQIMDVAIRGYGADYLIGDDRVPMEVAGRSRKRDLESAWSAKVARSARYAKNEFFVCIVEFESMTGKFGLVQRGGHEEDVYRSKPR